MTEQSLPSVKFEPSPRDEYTIQKTSKVLKQKIVRIQICERFTKRIEAFAEKNRRSKRKYVLKKEDLNDLLELRRSCVDECDSENAFKEICKTLSKKMGRPASYVFFIFKDRCGPMLRESTSQSTRRIQKNEISRASGSREELSVPASLPRRILSEVTPSALNVVRAVPPAVSKRPSIAKSMEELKSLKPSWGENEFKCAEKWLEIVNSHPAVSDEEFAMVVDSFRKCKHAEDVLDDHKDLMKGALSRFMKKNVAMRQDHRPQASESDDIEILKSSITITLC